MIIFVYEAYFLPLWIKFKKSSMEEKFYECGHISIVSTEIICKTKKFRWLWQSIIRGGHAPQFS